MAGARATARLGARRRVLPRDQWAPGLRDPAQRDHPRARPALAALVIVAPGRDRLHRLSRCAAGGPRSNCPWWPAAGRCVASRVMHAIRLHAFGPAENLRTSGRGPRPGPGPGADRRRSGRRAPPRHRAARGPTARCPCPSCRRSPAAKSREASSARARERPRGSGSAWSPTWAWRAAATPNWPSRRRRAPRDPGGLDEDEAVAMIGTGRTAMGMLEVAELDARRRRDRHGGRRRPRHPARAGRPERRGHRRRRRGRPRQGARRPGELGADLAVDYAGRAGSTGCARRSTARGEVALDGVGGALGRAALEILGPGGRMVLFGMASGTPTEITAGDLFARRHPRRGRDRPADRPACRRVARAGGAGARRRRRGPAGPARAALRARGGRRRTRGRRGPRDGGQGRARALGDGRRSAGWREYGQHQSESGRSGRQHGSDDGQTYLSLGSFYASDRRRATSRERDVGLWWRARGPLASAYRRRLASRPPASVPWRGRGHARRWPRAGARARMRSFAELHRLRRRRAASGDPGSIDWLMARTGRQLASGACRRRSGAGRAPRGYPAGKR